VAIDDGSRGSGRWALGRSREAVVRRDRTAAAPDFIVDESSVDPRREADWRVGRSDYLWEKASIEDMGGTGDERSEVSEVFDNNKK
jgi:hypothetical protein